MIDVYAGLPHLDDAPKPVKSVVQGKNDSLVVEAARLWIKPGDVVMDVTYGLGAFWRGCCPEGLICHDLALDGVDFRYLHEHTDEDEADVLVLDAPYLSKGGRETSTIPEFDAAYGLKGAPKTPAGVQILINQGIASSLYPLKHNGILMVKIMDYISSGKFFQSHQKTIDCAECFGFEQVDEFVHFSGTGPQPKKNRDGSPRRQVHSRRAHSFLLVFQNKGR